MSSRSGAKPAALLVSLVVSAYLTALAMEPSGPAWLAWVVLLPLFFAIRTQAPLWAMGSGALWGLGVHLFSVLSIESSASPTLLSVALLAVTPAVYAYLCARVVRSLGYCALLLGFAWVGVEVLLNPVLHDSLLVNAQAPGTLTGVIGRAFGSVAVAFLVAFANAVLLSVLCECTFRLPRLRPVVEVRVPQGLVLRHSVLVASSPAYPDARPRAPPI